MYAPGHLSQVLHQSQDYMRLRVAGVLLQALLQDVFEELYAQNKRMQVCTHQYTTYQALQVDVSKVRQLLVTGLHYAGEQQRAGRPVLLGLEDTLLIYSILSDTRLREARTLYAYDYYDRVWLVPSSIVVCGKCR